MATSSPTRRRFMIVPPALPSGGHAEQLEQTSKDIPCLLLETANMRGTNENEHPPADPASQSDCPSVGSAADQAAVVKAKKGRGSYSRKAREQLGHPPNSEV